MELDKSLISGSMALLVMKLLEGSDMYGYQMIEELKKRSDNTFHLKAGSLYPLLHSLEEKGYVSAYEQNATAGKPRRYYHLTRQGRGALQEREKSWSIYAHAVNRVLGGGVCYVGA
ncbi:PadR family transcriptional regulator, regulatory protein PadR [Oscillibacter sp. PC13]|uniref:PadR family transcriptional regulator n=1 Tax=Oscillibacter sp. PC13 TaxID=1855299 RepID=UPI0008E6485D|nr:PadR family transcriptional regulator [Oscillibacter sp. PC13]SFP53382.1 PadR family transcriptional regulator, regulatory protein PadR [Oscillibacter sp. PC13]